MARLTGSVVAVLVGSGCSDEVVPGDGFRERCPGNPLRVSEYPGMHLQLIILGLPARLLDYGEAASVYVELVLIIAQQVCHVIAFRLQMYCCCNAILH